MLTNLDFLVSYSTNEDTITFATVKRDLSRYQTTATKSLVLWVPLFWFFKDRFFNIGEYRTIPLFVKKRALANKLKSKNVFQLWRKGVPYK